MKIVRAPRMTHFTTLSNDLLADERLSFKARGLLAYLLSRPDGWHTDATRLAQIGPDGRRSILTGLSELEEAGYLKRTRAQDPDTGRWATQCEVFDAPTEVRFSTLGLTSGNAPSDDVSAGQPESTFSDVGKPHSKDLKTEYKKNPPTPAGAGARSHRGQHKNCRACGTNPRAPRSASRQPPPLAEVHSIEICEHGGRVGKCPSCRRKEAQ
jgi:hypothetical protein